MGAETLNFQGLMLCYYSRTLTEGRIVIRVVRGIVATSRASPFRAIPAGRPGQVQEEVATQAPTIVAPGVTQRAEGDRRTDSSQTSHVTTGMTPGVTRPVVAGHIPAEDVGETSPFPSVSGLQDAQEGRSKPSHGLSRAIDYWRKGLSSYPDSRFANKILSYVEFGVPIGYVGADLDIKCGNWPSANLYKEKVQEYIETHRQSGAIEGPLQNVSERYRTSPIGAFLKDDGVRVRVIHDLSHPPGQAVNDFINKEEARVSYSSVADAVTLCEQFSEPWLAKTDLKDAYLTCPVATGDKDLLGFYWEKDGVQECYRYASMALGLRSSAKLFTELAHALRYLYVKEGAAESTLYYLDDIVTVQGSKEDCERSLNVILRVVQEAGFEVQMKKTVGPSRVLEYLGIVIDTCKKELRISREKLQKVRDIVKEWQGKSTCTKRELLSLLGTLNHVSQVVDYGGLFVRRLIQASMKAKNLYHKVYLCKECRADLSWWDKNLVQQNGIKWFPKPFEVASANLLYSDASDTGEAAVLGDEWTVIVYEGEYEWLREKTIMYRELHAVVMAVATFSYKLRGSQVLMHIDNEAVHHCVKAAKCKEHDINCLLRVLYYFTSVHKIEYKSTHVPGITNVLADALSRQNYALFKCMAPNAKPRMCRPYRIPLDI